LTASLESRYVLKLSLIESKTRFLAMISNIKNNSNGYY